MSKVITKKELDLVIESTLEEAGLVSEKALCEECGGTMVEGICEGGCGKKNEDTLNEATMKEKNTYCQEKFGKDYKDCTKEQQKQCDENCGKVEEGNEFTGALAKAKEEGKDEFEVDGKTYKVEESTEDKNDKLLKEELNKFNKIINYRK